MRGKRFQSMPRWEVQSCAGTGEGLMRLVGAEGNLKGGVGEVRDVRGGGDEIRVWWACFLHELAVKSSCEWGSLRLRRNHRESGFW